MNNSEYFTKIAETVNKKRKKGEYTTRELATTERKKGEYTAEELRIYQEGRVDALKGVLLEMQEAHTFSQVLKKISSMQKFIKAEKDRELATREGEKNLWTNDQYRWTPEELMDFIFLNITDYRMRLEKARKIHSVQAQLIQDFVQLEIK